MVQPDEQKAGAPAAEEKPFELYLQQLEQLAQAKHFAPHHLVVDTARTLEDALVQAVLQFVAGGEAALKVAIATAKATPNIAGDGHLIEAAVLEQLTNTDAVLPSERNDITTVRNLRNWIVHSASREVTDKRAHELIDSVVAIVKRLNANYTAAAAFKTTPSADDDKYQYCRKQGTHESLPEGLEEADWLAGQIPLHNSRTLELEDGPSAGGEDEGDEGDEEDEGDEAKEEEAAPTKAVLPPTFCCALCHNLIAIPSQLQRIENNNVWTKPSIELPGLELNDNFEWGCTVKQYLDEKEGFVRGGKAIAAQCSKCHAYLGRFFKKGNQYRLIYIHTPSGQNFMYFKGDASVKIVPPLLAEENEAELPGAYASAVQAKNDPEPRFGRVFYPGAAAKKEGDEEERPKTAGGTSFGDGESDESRILTMLRAHPDPEYRMAESDETALQEIKILLATDNKFKNRRIMDCICNRFEALYTGFPNGQYRDTKSPVVPVFLKFFIKPADFTQAVGTARYAYHFLTGQDETKEERKPWDVRKFVRDLQKRPRCVVHFTTGEPDGHAFLLVKIESCYRFFQSNHRVGKKEDAYTLKDWMWDGAGGKWAETTDLVGVRQFLARFDESVSTPSREAYEDLFCRGQPAASAVKVPVGVTNVKYAIRDIKPHLIFKNYWIWWRLGAVDDEEEED